MDNVEELEKLYDPGLWSPFSSPDVIRNEFDDKAISASKKARQSIPIESVSYGPTERQKIDVFGASLLPSDAPIFVYIHGGYWMRGCREDSCFMVDSLFQAEFTCCVIGYDLAPQVNICDIVEQVEKGIKAVIGLAESLGSRGVYICGHSSGAHLAAMLLSSELLQRNDKVKGIVLLAGLYDLEPLKYLAIRNELEITDEILNSCSPMKLKTTTKDGGIQVLVVAAKYDSPEFIRQSYSYHQVLRNNGVKTRYVIVDEDHFTVASKLADEDYDVIKAIKQMADHNKA